MNSSIYHDVIEKLVFSWNQRLILEFERICYTYKISLKKTRISVEPLADKWGYWDSAKQVIVISKKLILEHSWDVVLQVLKHEMAHQIVDDIFKIQDSHGQWFQKACEMIGLEKKFQKASIDISEAFTHWKHADTSTNDEIQKLIKIEKLLNLAQSANENEAALAMAKVQELYEKYNLDKLSSENFNQQNVTLIISTGKKRLTVNYSLISNILQNHFFVRVIFGSQYSALNDESYQIIYILGDKENVLMAEYVYYFLLRQVDTLWLSYSKQKKLPSRYKLSYQRGILAGFYKKLDNLSNVRKNKINAEKNTETKSLISIHSNMLDSYVRSVFPRLNSRASSSSGIYKEHFDHGKEQGHKIILNKPISTSKNSEVVKLLK